MNERTLVAEELVLATGRHHRVLDGVSLTATPGRMLAVTGPSGSGKTTLLSLLGGLSSPTSGSVTYDARPVGTRTGEPRREIGYVLVACLRSWSPGGSPGWAGPRCCAGPRPADRSTRVSTMARKGSAGKKLPFDPIDEAARQWGKRWDAVDEMHAVTSLMRVQQLVLGQLDEILRPHGLTFARYEALVLLTFSRAGSLPLGKMGERLQVHPTSITSIIDRLEATGFVVRRRHPEDGRAVLAEITDEGRAVVEAATADLVEARFAIGGLGQDQLRELSSLLKPVRQNAGDF